MKIYARMIDQSVYEKRIKEVEETDNAIEVIEEDGSFVILPIRNIIYCKLQKCPLTGKGGEENEIN